MQMYDHNYSRWEYLVSAVSIYDPHLLKQAIGLVLDLPRD